MDELKRQYLLSREEITVPEAASLWGVNYHTVVNNILAGKLEGRDAAPPGLARARWRVRTASLKKILKIVDDEGVPA
jgi:hypothetical protein